MATNPSGSGAPAKPASAVADSSRQQAAMVALNTSARPTQDRAATHPQDGRGAAKRIPTGPGRGVGDLREMINGIVPTGRNRGARTDEVGRRGRVLSPAQGPSRLLAHRHGPGRCSRELNDVSRSQNLDRRLPWSALWLGPTRRPRYHLVVPHGGSKPRRCATCAHFPRSSRPLTQANQ